jgi:hypothetical protein
LPKKTLRKESLNVRFTEEEMAFLRRIAQECDQSLSEVIRTGVLRLRVEDIPERPRVPEVNRQLYLKLAQVSEALIANSSGIDPESLQRLEELLNETRLLLLGIPSDHRKNHYIQHNSSAVNP